LRGFSTETQPHAEAGSRSIRLLTVLLHCQRLACALVLPYCCLRQPQHRLNILATTCLLRFPLFRVVHSLSRQPELLARPHLPTALRRPCVDPVAPCSLHFNHCFFSHPLPPHRGRLCEGYCSGQAPLLRGTVVATVAVEPKPDFWVTRNRHGSSACYGWRQGASRTFAACRAGSCIEGERPCPQVPWWCNLKSSVGGRHGRRPGCLCTHFRSWFRQQRGQQRGGRRLRRTGQSRADR